MAKKLAIWGTGKIAELAHFYFTNDSEYEIVCHVDLDENVQLGETFCGVAVCSEREFKEKFTPKDFEVFVAIGYKKTNKLRQNRFATIKSLGFKCASYVSSKATVLSPIVTENCFILENNVIQPLVEINENVFIWSGNHIGHHSKIEKNVFLSSHVVISGNCIIGANSFLGVNSTIHDSVEIGSHSIIGACANVSSSCPERSVFVQVPTKFRTVTRDLI